MSYSSEPPTTKVAGVRAMNFERKDNSHVKYVNKQMASSQ